MSGTYAPPELSGVDVATLRTWLSAAQTALHELTIGRRVAEASYGQGDGVRTVKYSQADLPGLRLYIRQLQQAIDPTNPAFQRRAISVLFR